MLCYDTLTCSEGKSFAEMTSRIRQQAETPVFLSGFCFGELFYEDRDRFTHGPIVGSLLRFSLPILLALFLQALYGAVDLLVVGKYAAAAAS